MASDPDPSQLPQSHHQIDADLKFHLKPLLSSDPTAVPSAARRLSALLSSPSGSETLLHYVRSSASCSELLSAWTSSASHHVLKLISTVLNHPAGKSRSGGISKNLDHFARVVASQRLGDVYVELKSGEVKRQKAALRLLAAVVLRGTAVASEVARVFDFKLPVLGKLSGTGKGKNEKKKKNWCRKAFVEFAMSFLEVGSPRLLRWILQQRVLYSGVLRGLASDDSDTVVNVLSVIRDRVLTVGSLLPPALRSVLFGIAVLEQLVIVSGNTEGGIVADLAHEVLVLVCTDPRNGLMPDPNLKGNISRLLELMKKLKATESRNHRDLLVAIAKGNPSLCYSYLDTISSNLEQCGTHTWFTLAADLISATNSTPEFNSISFKDPRPPTQGSSTMRSILRHVTPWSFTRSLCTKGLLHFDILVSHGSLRLLLEILKSLHSILSAVDRVAQSTGTGQVDTSENVLTDLIDIPGFSYFCAIANHIHSDINETYQSEPVVQKWAQLKQDIQDEARGMLPDPQVLLNLLTSCQRKSTSSMSRSKCSKSSGGSLKRCAQLSTSARSHKRLKSDANTFSDDIDIVISGIGSEISTGIPKENGKIEVSGEPEMLQIAEALAEVWGISELDIAINDLKDVDAFFHMKLLDVLAFYLRTIPKTLDGSFDFFKLLPKDPSCLSPCQQQSLLSLLVECIGKSAGNNGSYKVPEMMYKHLQPLLNILLHSQEVNWHNTYTLAWSAMLSTGAFDNDLSEIEAWFLFLPGYKRCKYFQETNNGSLDGGLAAVIIPFFCDAVSTMGNNLYKNLDQMRIFVSNLEGHKDTSPTFSPLVITIVQKCLRLLESDSGSFNLSNKTTISLYVCNTLNFLLQNQVCLGSLPGVINFLLSEKFDGSSLIDNNHSSSNCEWRPFYNLLCFSRSILHQQSCTSLLTVKEMRKKEAGNSLTKVLRKAKKLLRVGSVEALVELALSLSSSILCANRDDIVNCFPVLVKLVPELPRAEIQCLFQVFFHEWDFLSLVFKLWPDMFRSGSPSAGSKNANDHELIDSCLSQCKESGTAATGRLMPTSHTGLEESSDIAFSWFLDHLPFHLLFTSVMNLSVCSVLVATNMLDLLRAKISQEGICESILSLRVVLFWANQIRSTYNVKPSDDLERLFMICFALVEHAIQNFIAVKLAVAESRKEHIPENSVCEVAELIILHPVITESLTNLLPYKGCLGEICFGSFSDLIFSSKGNLHPIDHYILRMFVFVVNSLISLRESQKFTSGIHTLTELLMKVCSNIIPSFVDSFKVKFSHSASLKSLQPLLSSFFVLHCLLPFVSPFDLLPLVHLILCEVNHESIGQSSSKASTLSIALCVAGYAFKNLSSALCQQKPGAANLSLWELSGRKCRDSLLEDIVSKILECSIDFKLELADACFLEAIGAVHNQIFAKPAATFLPFSMLMLRTISCCSAEIVVHCIYSTTKTKARILFKLMEISFSHQRLFGINFFNFIGEGFSAASLGTLRNEEFILLLPAALLCLNGKKVVGYDDKLLRNIPTFYSRILLDGFSNWKEYVSLEIFNEDYNELISTLEEFQSIHHSTMLGKALHMLQYFFTANPDSVKRKRRLKIFEAIYNTNELLSEFDLTEMEGQSYRELFNLVNKVSSKISFTWLLLFSQENLVEDLARDVEGDIGRTTLKNVSKREKSAKIKFMDILVRCLDKIVSRTSFKQETLNESKNADWFKLLHCLEISVLSRIQQLAGKMVHLLKLSKTIPFLESFIKSSLSHRFGDAITFRAVHKILVILKGGFLATEVLQLLLGHSKFISIILGSDSASSASDLVNDDTFLQPVPSIIGLVDSTFVEKTLESKHSFVEMQGGSILDSAKLEVVKLLRFLFQLAAEEDKCSGGIVNMNMREMISLFLSGYGASLSETDANMFHLLLEIESIDGSSSGNMGEMDYLWGSSAMKIRKEQSQGRLYNSKSTDDCENVEDRCRRLFRENILVDSKACALTVLHFHYERSISSCDSSKEVLVSDVMRCAHNLERPGQTSVCGSKFYDPRFILRFSVHNMFKGYIDPVEFARIGLLAIAFVSISSPDEDLRKLGYEVLQAFQKVMMKYENRKDFSQLRLLLTYLQNGITEPLQKIPSLTAVFVAEASFIVLDHSHVHFKAISKHLTHSPQINLDDVPLFHTFFRTSSIHFKTERLWILRLIYAGLNHDDDAQVLMKKFTMEFLMNFYASSLSDREAKSLILEILKKSMKLHGLACRLVRTCGLLSWLHGVLLFNEERMDEDQSDFFLKQLGIVLEVILDVISLTTITKWLTNEALEQLLGIATFLHKLLVGSLKSLKGNVMLLNSIVRVISSTLRISQKRKVYQPHFTLSVEGIFQLYQAIDKGPQNTRFNNHGDFGMEILLMNTPPTFKPLSTTAKARLAKVVLWAVPSALHSYNGHGYLVMGNDPDKKSSDDLRHGESLLEKLLRWISGSVILGFISSRHQHVSSRREETENQLSFLDIINIEREENGGDSDDNCSISAALAITILYLQQVGWTKTEVLPSVTLAVCLLLHHYVDNRAARELFGHDYSGALLSLCSKIRCPAELNPSWRWSFYEPWKDLSFEQTRMQSIEEEHACQMLLLAFSNSLNTGSATLSALSHQDLERLFSWEKDYILRSE